MTFDEAMLVLSTPPPPVPTARLTIPEGYRLTQIAERVHEALGIPQDRFLHRRAGHGSGRSTPTSPRARGRRGSCSPRRTGSRRTPRRRRSSSACSISSTRRPKALDWANAKDLGVSDYEVVVIASMIEREARVPSDRAKISAVIYNRLAKGMPLGIDATIGYIDPDPVQRAHRLRLRDRQPVQHAAAHRAAADADREPGHPVAPRGA